jgi:hypothetical protein
MVESPGKNVRQKAALNREILEALAGMMVSMLRYEAERAGSWFAVIDARNISQAMLGMRPLGPKGPVGPYPKDARIARIKVHRDVKRPGTSETGRSGSVERLYATEQRPCLRPSLRKP